MFFLSAPPPPPPPPPLSLCSLLFHPPLHYWHFTCLEKKYWLCTACAPGLISQRINISFTSVLNCFELHNRIYILLISYLLKLCSHSLYSFKHPYPNLLSIRLSLIRELIFRLLPFPFQMCFNCEGNSCVLCTFICKCMSS